MREIKFKGKRTYNGQWVEGYLYGKNGIITNNSEYTVTSIGTIITEIYEVDPLTIGQYTGLRDKNGTMIFEGDIVKIINSPVEDDIFTVEWSDGKEFCIGFGLFSCFEYEVIGNIHEVSE